jgi:hypothetical protein
VRSARRRGARSRCSPPRRVALRTLDDASSELRHHDLVAQLDPTGPKAATLQRTVTALDTWQHRADGDTITIKNSPPP